MMLIKTDKIPCSLTITKEEYKSIYAYRDLPGRTVNVVFNRNTKSALVDIPIGRYLADKYDFIHVVGEATVHNEPNDETPRENKNDKAKSAPRNTNKSRRPTRKI